MFRNRLVMGINDDTIQKRLLSVECEKLPFTKAFEIATSTELATSGAKYIRQQASSPVPAEVSKVEMKEFPKTEKTCYRCGEKHNQEHSPFKDMSCFYYGKEGHLAKVCKAKQISQQTLYTSKTVNQVTVDEQEEPDQTYNLFSIGGNNSAYKTMLCIDDHNIEMEIDTGSAVTLISSNTFGKFSSAKELEKTKAQLGTYTGEDAEVLGATTV